MAWIELHSTVREHYKTYALAEALRAARCTAVGIVCSLWAWAIDNAQDGDLSRFPPAAISAACCWDKKPDILIAALKSSGYVDDDMRIHDWDEYAGRLLDARNANAERQARHRAKKKSVTEERDVTVTSRVTLPLRNGATVPNQTVPNQTVPNHNEREGADAPMHAHENDPAVIVPEYHPPANVERVQEYARAIAAPPSFDAQAFIDYYAAQGWKRKGTPITDWRPLVRSWIRNERNMPRREAQDETTADYYLRRVREAEENERNGNAGGEAADDPLGYLSALF